MLEGDTCKIRTTQRLGILLKNLNYFSKILNIIINILSNN